MEIISFVISKHKALFFILLRWFQVSKTVSSDLKEQVFFPIDFL